MIIKRRNLFNIFGVIFMYLHLGTSELKSDLFIPISDSNAGSEYKPSGGLWTSKYVYDNYNEWIDFILGNPHIYFYKNNGGDIFNIPCCLIKLKESANIYNLDNMDSYNYLMSNYSNESDWFSFEKLSKDYDGININLSSFRRNNNKEILDKLMKYAVDSLVIFNMDSIEYYYSGVVNILPFDYEYDDRGYGFRSYKINLSDEKRYLVGNSKKR